jgi:DMSO reductase anchor subunit
MLWFALPGRSAAGLATLLAGVAGITCSARIYIVRARPAWNSPYTIAEFFSTALLLGPLFVVALEPGAPAWLRWAATAGASSQLLTQLFKFLWLSRADTFELRGSSLLLSGRLRSLFVTRLSVLVLGGVLLPLIARSGWQLTIAFLAVLAGEWLGRYLFFVSVVPKNIAAAFTSGERSHA